MQKLFNRILVPVDFTKYSKSAVEQAVDLGEEFQCKIILVHVVPFLPFSPIAFPGGYEPVTGNLATIEPEIRHQLEKVSEHARIYGAGRVSVDSFVLQGSWNECIIQFANQNNVDVILIGQKGRVAGKRKLLLDPDIIAEQTNLPVITVPSNRRITKLLSVVIPVTEFLPVRKLMYGIFMAARNNATIKLLAVETTRTGSNTQYYLEKSYSLIRENSKIVVETDIIRSNNVAEAIFEFSRLHSADLIIVNPGTQTRMRGFFSSILRNIIQRYSAPPVLTITPLFQN